MKFLYLCSLLIISASCANTNNRECFIKRSAFDLGSGSTKMKVALVNTCEKKIVKILHKESKAVAYKEELEKSKNNKLNSKIINKGIVALNDLKKIGISHGATEFYGVATSAFRTATNGQAVIEKIARATGLRLKRISQKEEAELGYLAVKSKLNTNSPIAVWDIGGGSMQIVSENKNNTKSYYFGKTASVGFKNLVLKKILKKSSKTSPNPMGPKNGTMAWALAKDFAIKDTKQELKKSLEPHTTFYGVGGVHYYSLRKQVGSSSIELNQIKESLMKRSKLTDYQINTKYSQTDITNLALVGGFMEALGLEKLETLNINLADYLLESPTSLMNLSE